MVAQNRGNLCVWYNIEVPDRITTFQIKVTTGMCVCYCDDDDGILVHQGEVTSLARSDGHTEVFVQSGMETLSYTLDEGMIEFRTGLCKLY